MQLLSIFFFLTFLLSMGCDSSEDPQQRRQEIDQIIERVAALNAGADEFRVKALEYDGELKAYRQEIEHLRSQAGEGRKERKARIKFLKNFANQAKKSRKAARIRVMLSNRKVRALVEDFDFFSGMLRQNVSLSDFKETFGEPDIVEENICYYMGAWTPGATLLKVRFSADTILGVESERYDESALVVYIPKLIESLKSENANVVLGAHSFLYAVMTMTYPNGYGEYVWTDNPYKNTPFEKYEIAWDTNFYQQWKDWWALDGRADFRRMARDAINSEK